MFDTLTSKLTQVFDKIRHKGIITEKNIESALREIKLSFLEADVNYKVVKEFINRVKEKAIGEKVLKSLSPDKQFVKIVYDELTKFLGESPTDIKLNKPAIIMLIGLQGSGKTTTAAKLANYLKKEKNFSKILLVGADTYRPAAKEQLKKLSEKINVDFFTNSDPINICKKAYEKSKEENYEALIIDTAGRLHIDEEMINELKQIKQTIPITDVLFVADSMLGQESVNIAKKFNEEIGITGVILTKLDGDTRGGAALSIKFITGVPIIFTGVGEKIDKFERFYPDRIANRILGMGDVVSLVEKVQKTVSIEEAKKAEEKFKKANFTLEDFLEQLKSIKKLGPLEEILKMIPGMNNIGNLKIDEKELKHIEAIILSMTKKERSKPEIINESRKKRIARGSGTSIEKVNRLLKQFKNMKKMMKKFGKKKGKFNSPFIPNMPF